MPAPRAALEAAPAPFASVTQRGDGRFDLWGRNSYTTPKTGDATDTLCDLAVEMVWEHLHQRGGTLCLHAAAVEIGGRLVVLPNSRRAGKSTLAVALAHAGARLYSDDVLPMFVDPAKGQAIGIAGGIAPRLRLPLPACSPALGQMVATDRGPANARYKYLADLALAPMGAMAPLGAIVLLDRQDSPTPASLTPAPLADVLSRLVLQQFARHIHAADILRATAEIAASLPLYTLRYSDFEQAAALLVSAPELQALPAAAVDPSLAAPRLADWQDAALVADAAPDACIYKPKGGYDVTAGSSVFAADPAGRGVRRLDGVSAVAWLLIDDGITAADLAACLQDVYPDIDPARLHQDALTCLAQFMGWGLITQRPPESRLTLLAATAGPERTE